MDQLKRLDFVGLVLFTGGLATFLIGLNWGGQSYPWKSAHTIGTLVVGFLSLVLFMLYDAYIHKGDPLLPMHLFKSRGYLAMVLTGMVGSCVYYSMNVLWPQQIAFLFPGSPQHNGWLACIIGGATLIGQILGGGLCSYINRTRFVLIPACVSLLVFSSVMATVNPGDENKGIAFLFIACASLGVIESCSLSLAPLACASEDLGVATGALGSIRSAGAAVATSIFVSVLTTKLGKFVPDLVGKAAVGAGLPESEVVSVLTNISTGTLANVKGITPEITAAVMKAYAQAGADSFRYVWYSVTPFGVLAVIAACCTIDYGKYLNHDVARKLATGETKGQMRQGLDTETERT